MWWGADDTFPGLLLLGVGGLAVDVSGYQSGRALVGEIGPRPLENDDEPIAESDQEEDVDKEPGEPGEESRKLDPAEVRHRRGAADGRQAAAVQVVKGLGRNAAGGAQNVPRRMPPTPAL